MLVIFQLIFLTALVEDTFACNGYSLKVNSIKNCITQSVIHVGDNFNVNLDRDCNIVAKGCATITKPFKDLTVHYTFSKPPMPNLSGDINVCETVKGNRAATEILTSFALPNRCPVKAQKICVNNDKKFNIGKYKSQLGYMAGNIKVKAEGTHDTGHTCIEADVTLKKGQ